MAQPKGKQVMTMKQLIMAAGLVIGSATMLPAQSSAPVMTVLKQASCGCCGGWVERMQQAGMAVQVRNVSGDELNAAKMAAGLPESTWACHTAAVAGYTVEGHVPAADIRRLLDERSEAIGIATPGMPAGSPGMEYGNERDAYDVVLVGTDGGVSVFASYSGN
jgi:hypothetical protein